MRTMILLILSVGFCATWVSADDLILEIEGEVSPTYQKAKYVKGIDIDSLKKYQQSNIEFITFHHEGFAGGSKANFSSRLSGRLRQSAVQRTENIHNQHVDSTFGMIAYNYIIGVSGEIVKGRPVTFSPATYTRDPETGEIANFDGHIAVMALGDFDFEPLLEPQLMSMLFVMSAAQREFRVPTENILPHRDHVEHNGRIGTTCPGQNMYDQRERLAKMTLATSLQTELADRNCYTAKIDGVFGVRSKDALERIATENQSFVMLSFDDETLWSILDNPEARCN